MPSHNFSDAAQRLSLGATVAVGATAMIADQDGDSLDPVSWSFTVRGADEVGSMAGAGTYTDMVTNKGMLYAVEDLGILSATGNHKYAIRVIDATDPSNPKSGPLFAEHGSWDPKGWVYSGWASVYNPFDYHEVNGLRVAQGVAINGSSRDLLMVLSRPFQATEAYIWENGVATDFRSRHNTIWVFDITGDDASFFENKAPKLLMVSSLGTLSDNWGKGLGSAGGVLGVIKLRGGLTLWDGDKWFNGFMGDAQELQASGAAWNGVQVLLHRARISKGYYPSPTTIVASNGFYNPASGSQPSVTSGVITDDADGRPIGFATMGYSEGRLVYIQTDVGSPMALATFNAGGCDGMDSRVRCFMNDPINGEKANRVEVLKGSWQGVHGTEQGTLLLVATTAGNFWVIHPDLSTSPMLTETLAKASLPANITRIVTDPAKMLVGVEAGGKAYIFDLKTLVPSDDAPMMLTPIYTFPVTGAWTLNQGYLVSNETILPRVVIKNLDGIQIKPQIGIPLLVDANQFFAGAFYEYNRTVLGDPNPPPQPQMPERLIYSMTDMQGQNNGYPALRHYYPDLGEMHISGVVDIRDPKQFLEATKDDSQWFMVAEAKLYDGDSEVPGAVTIEGLNISGDQRTVAGNGTVRSRVYGNGDRAKAELTTPRPTNIPGPVSLPNPPWMQKFAYAPYRFFIKPDVLTRLDQDMRTDFKERYRVKIILKLYRDQIQRAAGPPETTLNTFEFAVKFNSNTRLFDVLRGGVWYFDPVVASTDPQDTQANPFTASWLQRLVDANGQPIDVSGIFQTRLSLTPGTIITKGTNFNGVVFDDDTVGQHANSLAWFGLDTIQAMLNDSLVALRRQYVPGQISTRRTPWAQLFRKVFQEAPKKADGNPDYSRAADALGAYGYRMAHIVNAIQAFSVEEAGERRDIETRDSWAPDPTLQAGEKDPEGRDLKSRILPVIYQRLKNGQEYNPGNVLVNYLVAYPRLQTITPDVIAKGLYPINTLLTRDLVVGPMGEYVAEHKQERDDIDAKINALNQFKSLHYLGNGDMDAINLKATELATKLMQQTVVADAQSLFTGAGAFFNRGLGILQLGLQHNWLRRPIDDSEPAYTPDRGLNRHVYVWNEQLGNPDYESDGFNLYIRNGITDHLLKHLQSNRVDVYINGVQNVPHELEESADRLQQKLDELGGVKQEDPDSPKHVPIIAVYNTSAKKYYGGNNDLDFFDASDILRQKRDTALRTNKTANPDTIKLIGVLKGLTQVLFSKDFELAFFKERLKGKNLPERVWTWGPDGPSDLNLVEEAFMKNAVYVDGTWKDFVEVTPLARKTRDRIEDEFPVDEDGKTPEQILAERKNLFNQAAASFKAIAVAAHLEVHRTLTNLEPTLHAHSQGAIIAAVAHNRLGSVPSARSIRAEQCIAAGMPGGAIGDGGQQDVAKIFRYVSYGGGANMLDYGSKKYFKSYAHHVNEKDEIAAKVGMIQPFQNTFKMRGISFLAIALGLRVNFDDAVLQQMTGQPKLMTMAILPFSKGSAITDIIVDPLNPHALRILGGPSDGEQQSWRQGDHMVIWHASTAPGDNTDEHNFVNGYICTIDTDKTGPGSPKPGSENPKEGLGGMGCLYR